MLKIRFSKTGKRSAPAFRIVVTPESRPRDGRALEVLGHFNPSTNPPALSLDRKRLQYWLERGAQMTDAVEQLARGKYEFKPYRHKQGNKPTEGAKEPKVAVEEKKPAQRDKTEAAEAPTESKAEAQPTPDKSDEGTS